MADSCEIGYVSGAPSAARSVPGFQGVLVTESLNADPFNLRAEELALQECTLGVEVRRTWSELEMVRSFGGEMSPGTPDGMFESWDGDLTCVQVVRVPLLPNSDICSMQSILAQTVITKVVKSQSWLRFTQATPRDFIIFCWLPYSIPDAVAEHAKVLMERIRSLDNRFSLRLRTPSEPRSLFPNKFAQNSDRAIRNRSYTESDVSTYQGSCSEISDDEAIAWDITWSWEEEPPEILQAEDEAVIVETTLVEQENQKSDYGLSKTAEDVADIYDEFECEWNIWDDNG